METRTRGKGTIDHGLQGSVRTLDDVNPTRLSKRSQAVPLQFLLDFLHYLYNYYIVCALLSHTYHVIHHVTSCDITLWHPVMWLWLVWHLWCDTFPHSLLCSKSKIKEKKKKENINNNLVVLLSHDNYSYYQPWSDNEWLVDEMMVMWDEDITMQ